MKLALVCDDLIQFGGAEKVFLAVSKEFPEAPVFTAVISDEWKKILNEKGIKFHTSFMQNLPFITKIYRYYSSLFFHVYAMESFNLNDYDTVLSFSSRYGHFVITKPGTKHICYMHSPGRMFWEPFSYFESENYGYLKMLKKIGDLFVQIPSSILRILDYISAQRVDKFIANSQMTQKRIKKYYGLESVVINPFIDLSEYTLDLRTEKSDYFLIITRLASWKKVDIAIDACESLGLKLKIIGDGPAKKDLLEKAGSNTELLGHVSDKDKIEYLKNCIALIATQQEDFGITTLEALSLGKPVIAFRGGGSLEILKEGVTGEFYNEQTSDSLKETLRTFNPSKYLYEDCRNTSENYDIKIFLEKIKELVA